MAEAENKPTYGEVGFEEYILVVDYPFTWTVGHTETYSTVEELDKAVEDWKAISGPPMTEKYVSVKVGVVTRVN